MNVAQVEAFCRKLTELGRKSGELPKDWEFCLPTEAQWEYACRAGTTIATAFGNKLGSKQANFKGKPYNGGESGPSPSLQTDSGGISPFEKTQANDSAWSKHTKLTSQAAGLARELRAWRYTGSQTRQSADNFGTVQHAYKALA